MAKYLPNSFFKKIDDKVTALEGRAVSDENFTTTLKSKLNAIAANATANDSDANLKNLANHTGQQAASTISDFNSVVDSRIQNIVGAAPATLDTLVELAAALGDDANFAATVANEIAGIKARITTLENWKAALKINKLEAFNTTTNASGVFTVTTSTAFTNPVILDTVSADAGDEGYHAHISAVSDTTITGKAFRNKTQGVLLGGTIDPDNPVGNGTAIKVLVAEIRT